MTFLKDRFGAPVTRMISVFTTGFWAHSLTISFPDSLISFAETRLTAKINAVSRNSSDNVNAYTLIEVLKPVVLDLWVISLITLKKVI